MNNSHKIEVTLNDSWLYGKWSHHYPEHLLNGPMDVARAYFNSWDEIKVRQCWQELEIALLEFINTDGKRSYLTNPITVLANDGILLKYKYFQKFYAKWLSEFNKINLNGQKIYLSNVLLALYLLKNAADGNISITIDIYDRIADKELIQLNASFTGKKAIADQNRMSAKADRRSTLRKTIDEYFKHNPKTNYKIVLKYLQSQKQHH